MKCNTSYGVACVRFNPSIKKYEMLLIEKRYTYAFILFVRGCYLHNKRHSTLRKLFNEMTREEKKYIMSGKFDLLYYHAFMRYGRDIDDLNELIAYNTMRQRYERFSRLELCELIDGTSCSMLIWEFPKGRKRNSENDFICAIREFEEETGIHESDYEIISNQPFKVEFSDSGSNYVYYIYIAITDAVNTEFLFDVSAEASNNEISNIKWISSDISKNYLSEKLNLAFKSIIKIIKNNKKINDNIKRKITESNRKINIKARIR